jgi:hypothetical protein
MFRLQFCDAKQNSIYLVKRYLIIVDLTGREVAEKKNILLFYIYSDGSTERIFIVD